MAASLPQAPTTITTVSQNTDQVTFSWNIPDNGGDPSTPNYEIDWDQGSNIATWVPLVTSTSGANSQTVTGLSAPGDTFSFVIRTRNSIGASSDSAQHSIIAATAPDAPHQFVRDDTLTSTSQVSFSWSPPPYNGGSRATTTYMIEFDNSINDW